MNKNERLMIVIGVIIAVFIILSSLIKTIIDVVTTNWVLSLVLIFSVILFSRKKSSMRKEIRIALLTVIIVGMIFQVYCIMNLDFLYMFNENKNLFIKSL